MSGRLGRALAPVLLLAALVVACTPGDDGSSAGTTAPTVPPTTTSLPPGGRQPTPQDPLRVTFAGDSVMAEVAPALIQALEGTRESRARFLLAPSIARGGAGGVIWNRELERHRPELIVLLVGFWEDKIVGETASGQPGWAQQYRRTVVDPFLDMITRDGAKVLWIGMAAVADPTVTARFARMNSVYVTAADARDDVDFLPAGEYLSTPDGRFATVLPAPASGVPQTVRRTDGLHICPDGVVRLGQPVLEVIAEQWNIDAAYGWQQGSWRRPPLLHAPEECPAPV
ncbi:MAG TPA: hypothetical protein VD926_03960 [Acidimicrobiales bacterium]|nr:hypothetical protein [Acidimicrobiales bacterium]